MDYVISSIRFLKIHVPHKIMCLTNTARSTEVTTGFPELRSACDPPLKGKPVVTLVTATEVTTGFPQLRSAYDPPLRESRCYFGDGKAGCYFGAPSCTCISCSNW